MSKQRNRDWHPEDIKAAIRKRNVTLTDLALANDLPEGSIRYAAHYPHFDGEMVIAEFLGLSPRQIWPSRFKPDGSRNHRRRTANNNGNRSSCHCQKTGAA